MTLSPRVTDPRLVPTIPPSEVARKLLGDLGTFAVTDGCATLRMLADHLEAIGEECYAGRPHGLIAATTDLRITLLGLTDLLDVARTAIGTILALDPAFGIALRPAMHEENIRLQVLQFRRAPVAAIRNLRAFHETQCKDPGCAALEAMRRSEIIAMGGQ